VAATLARDVSVEAASWHFEEAEVRRRAAASGIRCLLSGWGGDEVIAFNGRGYLADLFRQGRWLEMGWEIRRRNRHVGGRFLPDLWRRVALPLLPDGLLALAGRDIDPVEKRAVAHHGLLLTDGERAMQREKYRSGRERPGVRRNQLALLARGHLARRIGAWAAESAALGLEYRYPLLDRRLISFALSLPAECYFHNGWKRYLFRLALAGIVPAQVQWAKQKGEPARQRARRRAIAEAGRQLWLSVQDGTISLGETSLVPRRHLAPEGRPLTAADLPRSLTLLSQEVL
jgi:asparagine synthase (glutamine-hydrolysing)